MHQAHTQRMADTSSPPMGRTTGFIARVLCRAAADNELVRGVTEDIGVQGVFVNARSTPDMGARVELTLVTARGIVRVGGEVVHRLEGVGFGCKFVGLDRDELQVIRQLVEAKHRLPAMAPEGDELAA